MTTTAEMADFVLETAFDDLRDDTVEAIKKRVLDAIAIATGAIEAEPITRLRRTVGELNGDGPASIWGSDRSTSPPLATALNGGMVRYLDFMDAYLLPDEVPHPSNNVAPTVVSAEYTDAAGPDLITAIGIAYEIHYQLARRAPLMDRGWDHGTYVTFSASAAAGSLFALDRDELRNAIGIAGVGHNALRVTRTGELSMWKGLSASNAARNAVYAVMLAHNGMDGPIDVFEGQKGWKEVVSGPFEVEYSPGEAVHETMTKRYMAGTVAQTALDGLDELLERYSIPGGEIESIEVATYKRAKTIMGGTGEAGEAGDRHVVTSREEADHSLPYTMAALALDGTLGHEQYRLDRIRSPDVQELLRRVHVREDPDLTDRYEAGEMPAVVEVMLTDGTVHEVEKAHFEGHPARPVTWEALESKFASLATDIYGPAEQAAIVDTVRNLEEIETAQLIDHLTPA